MNQRVHGKTCRRDDRSRQCDVRRQAPIGMRSPQYRAEVPSEEQQGNARERDKEGGDLVARLAVVGVPNLGAERVVAGRIDIDEVPHRHQHDEEGSKEWHESELGPRRRRHPIRRHRSPIIPRQLGTVSTSDLGDTQPDRHGRYRRRGAPASARAGHETGVRRLIDDTKGVWTWLDTARRRR
jgi:hypothetical protein